MDGDGTLAALNYIDDKPVLIVLKCGVFEEKVVSSATQYTLVPNNCIKTCVHVYVYFSEENEVDQCREMHGVYILFCNQANSWSYQLLIWSLVTL